MSWSERLWTAVVIGSITLATVAVLLLTGCASKPAKMTITEWPGKMELSWTRPVCVILDILPAPEPPVWPTADEDYYKRVYVHRRDYDELVKYTQEVGIWIRQTNSCLRQMAKEFP